MVFTLYHISRITMDIPVSEHTLPGTNNHSPYNHTLLLHCLYTVNSLSLLGELKRGLNKIASCSDEEAKDQFSESLYTIQDIAWRNITMCSLNNCHGDQYLPHSLDS